MSAFGVIHLSAEIFKIMIPRCIIAIPILSHTVNSVVLYLLDYKTVFNSQGTVCREKNGKRCRKIDLFFSLLVL